MNTSYCKIFIFIVSVEIKAVTWQKDSHGLFDYESTNHKIQKFIAGESCCLNIKSTKM